jgi:hypothetical protein
MLFPEMPDAGMRRTYLLVVICEIAVVAALWLLQRALSI